MGISKLSVPDKVKIARSSKDTVRYEAKAVTVSEADTLPVRVVSLSTGGGVGVGVGAAAP